MGIWGYYLGRQSGRTGEARGIERKNGRLGGICKGGSFWGTAEGRGEDLIGRRKLKAEEGKKAGERMKMG